MAKAESTETAQEDSAVIMDTMPGADSGTEPQSTEKFAVDLNFENAPAETEAEAEAETEEVEFPKEEVVEENLEAEAEAETTNNEAEPEAAEEEVAAEEAQVEEQTA